MIEYSHILIFILLATLIASIIIAASYILGIKNPDLEKVSIYECGFDPFGDSRQKFEIRFFLVCILFIIFDLEISFLFPWSIVISFLTLAQYWIVILFFAILVIGLIYEWLRGGLEWE